MLKLNDSQVASLDHQHAERFLQELAAFLRAEFTEELMQVDDAALLRMCRAVVDEAESLGIDEQGPVAQLACLAMATNGGILRQPEIREYLANTELGQRERVQLLVDTLESESD